MGTSRLLTTPIRLILPRKTLLACQVAPLFGMRNKCQPPRRGFRLCQASAAGAGGGGSPSEDTGGTAPGAKPASSSGGGRTAAVPLGVPTAGTVFFLAGFLKLLVMCFPFSPIAVAMYLTGRVDLGYWAVLKMLPLSLGLAALSKYLIDKKLQERTLVRWAIVLGSIAALFLSRLLFYTPGPKPGHVLNPMIQAAQQARVARDQEHQEIMAHRQAARERALRGPGDAAEFLKAREQMRQGLPPQAR